MKKHHFKKQYNRIEWKLKAIQVKRRDNFTCQCCGNNKDLHVHHLVYLNNRNIWDYPANYLITLCNYCHISEHVSIDYLRSIKFNYKNMVLNGMLCIDIYAKIKNKETLLLT